MLAGAYKYAFSDYFERPHGQPLTRPV